MQTDPKDVCFVGLGTSAPCYYRVMLPAMALGTDWVGITGYPPHLEWVTGSVRGESQLPDFVDDYKVVILQQPHGESWRKMIEMMQERGKKVVFEVDDYLHGIEKLEDHDFAKSFDKRAILQFEDCMRACDAIICSTEFIRRKYKKINPNIFLCRNGIDLARYKLTRPKRDTVNIGWSGATGHIKAMMPWLNFLAGVMENHKHTCFVSIGMPFANSIKHLVGEDRAISIPFAAIEQYPAAMSMIDIALAPGGSGGWYKGKSDLRWLEASALGIPIIARPSVYPEIEPGVTGFHATAPTEMVPPLVEMLADVGLRERVGSAAREYVMEHRSIRAMSGQWADAIDAIAG